MIIPIRCMNCGRLLADEWRWYQKRVATLRHEKGLKDEPVYINGKDVPDRTPERQACDELGIVRYCCRKVFLTHRDILDKI